MTLAISIDGRRAIDLAEHGAARERRAWLAAVWTGRVLLACAILGVWQFSAGKWVDESFSSSPTRIASAFWELATQSSFYRDAGLTAFEFFVGWGAGVTLGLLLACALMLSKFGYRLVEPFLLGLYGIPMVALGPVMLMWFGVGVLSKIVLAAQGAFTIVVLNAVAGMNSANPKSKNALELMGAGKLRIFSLLLLPTATPFILTSLRLTVATAMVGVVLGEFLGSVGGLGHLIQDSANYLAVDQMLASLFTIIAMTGLFQALLVPLERWGRRIKL